MIRGQSYKASTIVNYDSRVVIMGYFQVRYDSRVVIYDCRGFIRFATENNLKTKTNDAKGSKDRQKEAVNCPFFQKNKATVKLVDKEDARF